MAENNTKRGPGHGPGGPRGGFRKPKDLRGTLSKLMGYLGQYKALLVIVVILLFISAACSVAGSYLIKPLINDYILPGDFIGLAKMLCVMAGVYVVGAVCSYGYARIMVHVAQNTVAKLRADLFNKMQKLPLKFFDTHTHGELMSRYTNDIETVSEALNNSFASLISCSLTFVGTVMMMIVLSPILTAITAVMLGVMLLVVKTIGGRSRRYFAAQQKAIGAVNGYIEEMIEGQKVIKVFNHEAAASIIVVLALIGLFLLKPEPQIIQGQAEATQVRVSGKLPGRVVEFMVEEGQHVLAGDTLVHIHSSLVEAKLSQAEAMETVAKAQNKKVDSGTRVELLNSACVMSSRLMIPPISSAYLNSFSGVSLEENMISPFLQPTALAIISSVSEEQSQPQPYSCRILIRYGFGVAFTAKNSLNPLFHAKASFRAFAFSRIPFSS